MIHPVVFDLDGTLVDSVPDIAEIVNSVIGEYGFASCPPKAYRNFVGWGLRRTLELALPDETDRMTIGRLFEEVVRRYRSRPVHHTTVYPGIMDLLKGLDERGTDLLVYTNKETRTAEAVVSDLFSRVPFRAVVGFDEVHPPKPDPGALIEIFRRFGYRPESSLMVGDTPMDLQAARSAGIPFAGVLWGYRGVQELESCGSGVNFERAADLQHWILKEKM